MSGISGSLRKIIFDGLSFDVAADSAVTKQPKIEKEAIVTSGETTIKRTYMNGNFENVTIVANPQELELLEELSESIADKTMSLTYADGTVYRGLGQISLAEHSSDENKVNVTMIPRNRRWDRFGS